MSEILAKAGPALLNVTMIGLLLGAGLPALFSLGMKALGIGRPVRITASGTEYVGPPTTVGRAAATVAFGVVIAAALFGIVVIVFGKQIFAH